MEEIGIEKNPHDVEKLPEGRILSPHVFINNLEGSPTPEIPALQKNIERVHGIDNLRTFLVALLVLQHAVLETIARTPGDAEALFPKQYIFLDMFVGIVMEVGLGLLFFVSGYASSVSMVGHSRTPRQFILRKTIRSAILIIAGCFGAGITTYVYGPWDPVAEGQTSYYALKIGKASLLHGPIFYLLLLFLFDSVYAISLSLNNRRRGSTSSYFTSELRYNLAQYAAMFVLEIWTICIAGGIVSPPSFLSPLINFIHPAPQTLMQCAVGYLAGVHFSSYATYLLAEHSPNVGPAILRFSIRVWASTSMLFSLHRRFPNLITSFGSLKAAPRLSIPRDGPSIGHDLFAALYGLWSAITFVVLTTPIIQIFLTNDRLNRKWGVVSRATTIQPFIHMVFVFTISNLAGCIGNLILRCVVVGVGAIFCGWGVVSFGILVWGVLDGIILPQFLFKPFTNPSFGLTGY